MPLCSADYCLWVNNDLNTKVRTGEIADRVGHYLLCDFSSLPEPLRTVTEPKATSKS